MHRILGFFVVLGLAAACDAPCPGGHDPLTNPAGKDCDDNAACEVECVCLEGDDEIDIRVGSCAGGECLDATGLCEAACGGGNRTWSGEFCSPGS